MNDIHTYICFVVVVELFIWMIKCWPEKRLDCTKTAAHLSRPQHLSPLSSTLYFCLVLLHVMAFHCSLITAHCSLLKTHCTEFTDPRHSPILYFLFSWSPLFLWKSLNSSILSGLFTLRPSHYNIPGGLAEGL